MNLPLWRAVSVFRVAALGYAAFSIFHASDHYADPGAGWAALVAMAAWTLIAVSVSSRAATTGGRPRRGWSIWRGRPVRRGWSASPGRPVRRGWSISPGRPVRRGWSASPERPARRGWLTRSVGVRLFLAADVAVAVGLVLATRWVETTERVAQGAPTLPVAWAAAPVLACAVAGGPLGGLAAALAVGAADIGERGELAQSTFNSVVLLVLAGVLVGYVVRLWQRAETAVERAARIEAAAAERNRLARDIHDSVLQVLALVQRRGAEIGGEAAELGRLAGEQEVALRALVSAPVPGPRAGGLVDLRESLAACRVAGVTYAAPADPVLLPADAATAVAEAVGEALANVRRHAGPDARAWLLVEDEPAAVTVTVRDDGAGFASGRLEEAAAVGRLGVAQSIRGRVESLGGVATVTSEPGRGTEVEIRVARA